MKIFFNKFIRLSFLDKYRDVGLLILRIGIGIMFILHGYPKLVGGPKYWEQLGLAMGNLDIHFLPVFWGFMSAVTECFGGLFIALGFFFRITCIFLTINMIVAVSFHIGRHDSLNVASHAIEVGVLFLSLIITGSGKYCLDEWISKS